MKNSWFKKILVVGIILLFLGVGVQPVLSQNTVNNIYKEKISDLPCNCENKDIQGGNPFKCLLLTPLFAIIFALNLRHGLFEDFLFYLLELGKELNCSWA